MIIFFYSLAGGGLKMSIFKVYARQEVEYPSVTRVQSDILIILKCSFYQQRNG